MAALTGGIVAQEAVKAMTQKFMPIKQLAVFTCLEIMDEPKSSTFEEKETKTLQDLIGPVKFLEEAWVFMIGAGAIGCELLKNFAMLNVGTEEGQIIITDPDVIEVSNLNRQFLFREKHLRKPKSMTAAAAAI